MAEQSMGRLDGKVALITGGSRGNGFGISKCFVAEGAKVMMMANHVQEWGDQAVAELTASGGEAAFIRADVSVEDDVRRCVTATVERFGALHLLVNNAGATTGQSTTKLVDIELKDWHWYFSVNIDGPFLLCKHVIPHMLDAGYGSIVNISSNAAIRAGGSHPGYSASKAAIHGLNMSVAYAYGPVVRSNEIVMGHLHPPDPDNPIYQFMEQDEATKAAIDSNYMVRRWGRPADLGHLCAFLCSEEAGFITASTVRLDGGSQQVMRFPSLDRFPAWQKERESRDVVDGRVAPATDGDE
jgi:NAD(P)-dependent dehydrogenase (short-subunit alcohol dehydrogenase family)